jgi:hypothetical protein
MVAARAYVGTQPGCGARNLALGRVRRTNSGGQIHISVEQRAGGGPLLLGGSAYLNFVRRKLGIRKRPGAGGRVERTTDRGGTVMEDCVGELHDR